MDLNQPAITQYLKAWHQGDHQALDQLMEVVYAKIHNMARSAQRGDEMRHHMTPTDLAHDAFFSIAKKGSIEWVDRNHFFSIAARSLRRAMINHARERKAQKRGHDVQHREVEEEFLPGGTDSAETWLILSQPLDTLEHRDPTSCQIVELHLIAGFTLEETAQTLEISPATVKRKLRFAKSWLKKAIQDHRHECAL